MASFTTRVELHDAVSGDYAKLHVEMNKKGFTQTIISDQGTVYPLPTAEYNYVGTQTTATVIQLAKSAAITVKKSFGVLVTKAAGRTWHNLI